VSEALVEIRGLELHGFHGATEREEREGQRFVFDLELTLETTAVASDDLAETVDYREVVACVSAVADGRRFGLLEALAGAVADELASRFPLRRVSVRVRKPDVRLAAPVEYTAATVVRP